MANAPPAARLLLSAFAILPLVQIAALHDGWLKRLADVA